MNQAEIVIHLRGSLSRRPHPQNGCYAAAVLLRQSWRPIPRQSKAAGSDVAKYWPMNQTETAIKIDQPITVIRSAEGRTFFLLAAEFTNHDNQRMPSTLRHSRSMSAEPLGLRQLRRARRSPFFPLRRTALQPLAVATVLAALLSLKQLC
jgi:hypothetical protein